MAQSGDELKTALKLALRATPGKPHFFALLVKGAKDGALIVDKRRISTKLIDEAKKEHGATSVVRGLCHGEDGAIVFETVKRQSPAVAVAAKRLASVHAGVKIKPVFRVTDA